MLEHEIFTTEQTMNNQSIIERDLNVLWHPCTQMKDHEWLPLVPIKRGKGVWLEDFEGNRYLDAVSSWWVNLFGHSNPRLNKALQQQSEKLEHVLLAGFSHEAVIELAEKLVQLTPPGLDRCFFVDNGSAAVEAAIKMSFHYWKNCGQDKKQKFVTLSNSYHGETLGALAVGDVALYKETYAPLLMDVITVESPDCFHREPGESWHDYSVRKFAEMQTTLEAQHEEICAVILEPLVQCAGYMRMYHPVYLQRLRALCDKLNIHIIADEIAVGFGRTGRMFACEHAGISPDFLCLSKGITGGYLPLSVIVTHTKIYDAFYDDYATLKAFLHSHSYTGNALACSVALASLNIFQTDNILESNAILANHMQQLSAHLNDHPHVAEVRQHGMIMAIEMIKDKTNKTPYDWQERRGLKVYQHALKNEMLLRPLGNVVYFMPPYIITADEIERMINVAAAGIDIATQ